MLLFYDTTLRDGAQTEGVSFTLEDKLKIVKKLDDFGIDYIECGWPSSNPKDMELFKKIRSFKLRRSKITAFGSTRYKHTNPKEDKNLLGMLEAMPDAVCIFGKSWDLHVKEALNTTLDENLSMIFDSVKFLKDNNFEVIYDAEHFFDGYKNNEAYAIETVVAAQKAGADFICLCDTNGGSLPFEIASIIETVKKFVTKPLGIHTHNDAGLAVANSIVAVKNGISLVQGTINGYGERCGNADLCSIIPTTVLKMGETSNLDLERLKEVSYFVSEVANKVPQDNQPYVGYSAFTHKAGIHASAVAKNSKTYEHIDPTDVGNKRRVIISELSGKSNILAKAKELNINLDNEEKIQEILDFVKRRESEGYQFEGAEASFELALRKLLPNYKKPFDLESFRVITEKDLKGVMKSEATIKIKVGDIEEHTASCGDGPVNALDNALRKALEKFFPSIKETSLTDFKVRVIGAKGGTNSKVRVLIESRDFNDEWTTIGVSENILEASWEALVDAFEYKTLNDQK